MFVFPFTTKIGDSTAMALREWITWVTRKSGPSNQIKGNWKIIKQAVCHVRNCQFTNSDLNVTFSVCCHCHYSPCRPVFNLVIQASFKKTLWRELFKVDPKDFIENPSTPSYHGGSHCFPPLWVILGCVSQNPLYIHLWLKCLALTF